MDRIKKIRRSSTRLYNRLIHKENSTIEFTTTVKTERKSISWTIENVNRCPLNAGEYLESPIFKTGVTDVTNWCLRFYPKGTGSFPSKKAELYLYKITPATKVLVEVKLYRKNCTEETSYCNGSNQVCEEPEEIGSDKFISTEQLELTETLVIGCELKVGYLPPAEDSRSEDAESHIFNCNCAMSGDFEKLLNSGQFTDTVLQVGKKQFSVHKAILAARSTVFFAMFEHDMKERKTDVVTIEDVEPSTMANVLQHIYTGKIDSMNVEKAILLLEVADKYSLPELQKECSKLLLENMSVGNVCRIVDLADLHSCTKLKDAAMHFIRNYSSQVFDRREWEALTVDRPRLAATILKNIMTDYKTNCSGHE